MIKMSPKSQIALRIHFFIAKNSQESRKNVELVPIVSIFPLLMISLSHEINYWISEKIFDRLD